MLTSAANTESVSEMNLLSKESKKAKKRIAELDILIQKTYEDMTFGLLTKERYIKMSQNMENELNTLKTRVNEIADIMSENEKSAYNVARFTELIEKIYIHERENIDGKAVVKVNIYYRFIGYISNSDNPTEVNRRRS